MDVGRCDGALVDWKFLRRELEAWSQRPTADAHLGVDPWDWGREGRGGASAGLMEEVKLSEWSGRREWIWMALRPLRWMVLCIFSNWIARIPQVWEGCVVGASLSVLHASFCSEPGPSRNELFQQVVDGVSLQGWSGLALEVDWPIFDLVGAHAAVLSSGLWEGQEELFLVEPPRCSKLEPGDDDLGKASLITMHHALRVAETGRLELNTPEIVHSLNLLCSSQLVNNFATATACALKALAAPQEFQSKLLGAAESAAGGCVGEASMITALLRSPWPLARLLGRLRPKAPDTENPGAAPGGLRGLQWMPLDEEQLPYTPSGSGAQIYEQSNDVTFPWVQFIARAVPPQGLFMGLPWPQGLRFTDIQREAMQLLEAFPASNYPSPSNDRQTWRTLCLVCKDGLQDPATTTEGTVYAKTEILSLAPALEKFIDLFGPTGEQYAAQQLRILEGRALGSRRFWARQAQRQNGSVPIPGAKRYCEFLVDADSVGLPLIRQGLQMLTDHGYQVQTLLFAPPGRMQQPHWSDFVQEPGIFFQPVARDKGVMDATDEAIKSDIRAMSKLPWAEHMAILTGDDDFVPSVQEFCASGRSAILLLPPGKTSCLKRYSEETEAQVCTLKPPRSLVKCPTVMALLHATGDGSLQERQLQWPEERCLQLDEMLKTLAELGYYHPEDEFWHHAVAKFWFANSLGTVPVYPSWLLHDAVAMVLAPDAKRWTPRGARRWAFVLPRVDSEGPGLKAWKYASRLDAEVARAGIGPFMLEDSEDLAEEVLRRLGYLDPGEVHNSDFREAASAFCQCLHTNRYMLRKMLLMPEPGDSVQELKRKLREAFLSHNSNGRWAIAPEDSEIRSFLCQEGYLEATTVPEEAVFQAMQSYAKEKRLPAKRSRVRLSVVLPDGMIAWHPDARVVENGRLILHVPIQTNPRALTRVGQLLLHVPEGQLHWADFSIPHCVFNAGTQPRVHLIIDVLGRDNEDFARNFLAHLPTAEAERFRRHALPEVALGEASAVGPPGTRFARPLSRQMSDTFGMLVGAEMLSLERRIWEQVTKAYASQVA
ncbi:Asp_Arg_Hydrox domain-containing protein [Durusdinium trenchii]|uniref:Asp_Arg_Hydrox domain-containing protein n=1 Tax=Durusdinium trenchii TaxID=1381693 RepID=A0ABP0SJH3_9DINO